VTRNRYRAGTGTNTEVLDADALRVRAYFNVYSARYDAVLAGWRLRRATGSL
jgi:outer membrane protein TolC